MLSRDLLRSDPERVARALADRGQETAALDAWRRLDVERRETLTRLEELKRQRNEASQAIGRLKAQGGDAAEAIAAVASLKGEIAGLDARVAAVDEELAAVELRLPNLPHASVPRGADESANRVERVVGEPPSFDFEPKAHWDLGSELGILDFERGAKIAGARFTAYFGAGAALERALVTFMIDLHTREHGYTEVLPPYVVNSASLVGTGQLPKFEADLFHLEGTDYYLVPTAEVPVTNLHRDEILDAGQLPIRYCAFTPCFRSEAGSHGKDVRGLIRQHQFHKVELVHLATPETSYDELELMVTHAGRVLEPASPTASSACRPGTWASPPPRPTTWRSGSRVRTPIGRSPPARTARTSRHGGRTCATVARERSPASCTLSTAPASPSAGR